MAKIRDTAIPNNYGDGYKQEVIMEDNTMYKIENTPIPNNYGGGYQKEITSSNGKKYRIRNTAIPNNYGEGYKQEIYEVPTSNESSSINTGSTWFLYAFFILLFFPWTVPIIFQIPIISDNWLITTIICTVLSVIFGILYKLGF